ncbi:DNA-processing protein DprA [Synechococcus sp. RSCCF101]|uniref:DNA-processing protein DprA n=1 Tax=Synechococcus sp. RSCCF101 TaxID=2511069 RepID=UPI001CD943AB|nr:DNA-processing protein DprA [Synechococcus sp. RSCCF101]
MDWPARLEATLASHRRPGMPEGLEPSLPTRCLLPGDPAFPGSLHGLERVPLALFWRGRGSLWPLLRQRQAVAVVGTRRASPNGLSLARAIGRELALAGWPVVSGLAEGIDGAVHRGCLQANGAPVAVLGTPLSRAYPRHHAALQGQVGAAGLLVSEQPEGARVQAGHFAARNRLLASFCRAVVVVECPEASGALHSARIALAESLPLWVVPADPGRRSAAGSNALLNEGARALLDPADLTRALGRGPLARATAVPGGSSRSPATPVDGAADEVLAAIGHGADRDTLQQRLSMGSEDLTRWLVELELAGRIVAHPGLRWSRP